MAHCRGNVIGLPFGNYIFGLREISRLFSKFRKISCLFPKFRDIILFFWEIVRYLYVYISYLLPNTGNELKAAFLHINLERPSFGIWSGIELLCKRIRSVRCFNLSCPVRPSPRGPPPSEMNQMHPYAVSSTFLLPINFSHHTLGVVQIFKKYNGFNLRKFVFLNFHKKFWWKKPERIFVVFPMFLQPIFFFYLFSS